VPFAGSDFWIADLGLEYLHWPKQRLLKKEMRHSKFCDVLESVNPDPVPGGYARVVSWVMIESPHGIVHADAYDILGAVLKRFDPSNLEKIQGEYQVEEIEMRNRKTGSHTWIKFNLADKRRSRRAVKGWGSERKGEIRRQIPEGRNPRIERCFAVALRPPAIKAVRRNFGPRISFRFQI